MCSGVQKRGIAAGILQKQGTSTTNASPEGSTALKNEIENLPIQFFH
jgi:hypothetical protein